MVQQSAFSQNIVKELGLDSLPADQQAETLLKIGEIINQRIIIKVMEKLSEADKDEFDQLLGRDMTDQDAIASFLRSKIPDFDGMVAKEVADFKQSSVDFIKSVAG